MKQPKNEQVSVKVLGELVVLLARELKARLEEELAIAVSYYEGAEDAARLRQQLQLLGHLLPPAERLVCGQEIGQ